MKKYLLILIFINFWSCEDEEVSSDLGNDSIIGSWSFTATEYDSTCTGDGEIVAEGTMIFNETDVVITNNISFNSFCSDFNGALVDDTTCVLGGYSGNDTLTLSFMHGYCQSAGMILTNTGCSQTSTNSYTFSESLYIMYFTEYNVPDFGCSEMMGTYNESDSSCTYSDTVDISINGNNATFNEFYTDYYDSEYSICNVYELNRQ